MKALYCDGHCKLQDDMPGYARVTDEKGNCVMEKIQELLPEIKQTSLETPLGMILCIEVLDKTVKQQINYAEIMGLYVALKLANHDKSIEGVYCDSATALAWGNGSINIKNMDPNKLAICKAAQKERKTFIASKRWIKKISGDDNLADFGYHKKPKRKEVITSEITKPPNNLECIASNRSKKRQKLEQ